VLAASWVSAIAASVLAIAGLAGVGVWLIARRADRERRQREQADELQERTLERGRKEFASSDSVESVKAGAIVGLVFLGLWYMSRKEKAP
jgi:hypothetical protein